MTAYHLEMYAVYIGQHLDVYPRNKISRWLMGEHRTADSRDSPGVYYEIRLLGVLDARWIDWFEGLCITLENERVTRLSGELVDQAALHGVLKKVRDLGLPLLSLNRFDNPGQATPPAEHDRWISNHNKAND